MAMSFLHTSADPMQRPMFQWFSSEEISPLGQHVLFAVVVMIGFAGLATVIAMLGIWAERRIAGRIQSRLGPNRVGPMGLAQSLADGIKLLGKEDLRPREADGLLFPLAPYLAFAPAFVALLALPFGPDLCVSPALASGVFWVVAILSLQVIGVVLAGATSGSKWALYGAVREAGQVIVYEIPFAIAVLVVICVAGTLDLVQLCHLQAGGIHRWGAFANPFTLLAGIVFFVASLAGTKRAPFDLPESESELVAGYHTEYSGLRFSFFFLGEYVSMFVVSAVLVVLFLGGWDDPAGWVSRRHAQAVEQGSAGMIGLANALAATIFLVKVTLLMLIQIWVRWTLPRPRIDQVMYACVKVLLPFSLLLLMGATVWDLFAPGLPAAGPGGFWTSVVLASATGVGMLWFFGRVVLTVAAGGRAAELRLTRVD
jgi:NADH-quinone oxidoreductase subunit H